MFKCAASSWLISLCLSAPAGAEPCVLSAAATAQIQSALRMAMPLIDEPGAGRDLPQVVALKDATGRPCTVATSPPRDIAARDFGVGNPIAAKQAITAGSPRVPVPPADALTLEAGALRKLRFIDLGTLGGPSSNANALNDRGDVVGDSNLPDLTQRAFVWRNGAMQELGTLGGSFSGAAGINNRGQVVGSSQTASGEIHAYIWRVGNGILTDLGHLGGGLSIAAAINDAGHVVGASFTAAGELHAFSWTNGEMTDMGNLGGGFGFARAINAHGQAVGSSATAEFSLHAFRWQRQRGLVDLGVPPGFTDADATGISDSGTVVSVSNDDEFRPHAFAWTRGKWTELHPPVPNSSAVATGVNAAGEAVGVALIDRGDGKSIQHALVWSRRGVPRDLNQEFGWDASFAQAINSNGHVAGLARFAGSPDFRAFVLER